eukprot:1156440-Pelagomonas_calceolata.AAC.6
MLVGIWRVDSCTGLQNLAARSVVVFNCTLSGRNFVGVLHKVCMEFTCKLASLLTQKKRGKVRQPWHSVHQRKRKEKERRSYLGRGNSPYINYGTRGIEVLNIFLLLVKVPHP